MANRKKLGEALDRAMTVTAIATSIVGGSYGNAASLEEAAADWQSLSDAKRRELAEQLDLDEDDIAAIFDR